MVYVHEMKLNLYTCQIHNGNPSDGVIQTLNIKRVKISTYMLLAILDYMIKIGEVPSMLFTKKKTVKG